MLYHTENANTHLSFSIQKPSTNNPMMSSVITGAAATGAQHMANPNNRPTITGALTASSSVDDDPNFIPSMCRRAKASFPTPHA
jgi:hypothetical protein